MAYLGGLATRRIAPERDIDSVEDLAWMREHFAELETRGEEVPRHTAAVLAGLTATQTSGQT